MYDTRAMEQEALKLEGCSVDRGKPLGVQKDSEVKFDGMESKVCQAGYFQLGLLRILRTVLGKDEKLIFIKSLILSKMDYCSFLYAAANVK